MEVFLYFFFYAGHYGVLQPFYHNWCMPLLNHSQHLQHPANRNPPNRLLSVNLSYINYVWYEYIFKRFKIHENFESQNNILAQEKFEDFWALQKSSILLPTCYNISDHIFGSIKGTILFLSHKFGRLKQTTKNPKFT